MHQWGMEHGHAGSPSPFSILSGFGIHVPGIFFKVRQGFEDHIVSHLGSGSLNPQATALAQVVLNLTIYKHSRIEVGTSRWCDGDVSGLPHG